MTAIPERLSEIGIKAGDGEKKQVEFTLLDLAKISPSNNNPRSLFDQAEIEDLAASIASNGLLQPITVRKRKGRKEAYEIIAGERRFRAVSLLGWKQVAACIRECDDTEFLEMALIENLKRSGLTAMEKARGFAKLREAGREVGQIAKTLGISQPLVSNTLRLTQLLPEVQTMIEEELLNQSQGVALASLNDPHFHDDQLRIAKQAADLKWPSKHLETVVAAIKSEHERKINPALIEEPNPEPPVEEAEPVVEEEQGQELNPEEAEEPIQAPQKPALATPQIPAPESVPANPPRAVAPPTQPDPVPTRTTPPAAPQPSVPVTPPPTPQAPATTPTASMPGFVTLSIREELNAQLIARKVLAKRAIEFGLLALETIGEEGLANLAKIKAHREGTGESLEHLRDAVSGTLDMFLLDIEETTPATEATTTTMEETK